MKWFKKKEKPQPLSISFMDLMKLVNHAVALLKDDVDNRALTFGPEIMFEYRDDIHSIELCYDKRTAKANGDRTFQEQYLSIRFGKEQFLSVSEFRDRATVNGEYLHDIQDGIIVMPEYKEILMGEES